MSEQTHQSDPHVLGRRTLQRDHRALAPLLRPGMSVLDVGCGTGAITAGIAHAVGSSGRVVGVDRDNSLLDLARREHPGVRFEPADALALPWKDEFDVVTAARALQWIADPACALACMVAVAKPGGAIVVLDYNHERNSWIPDPPPEFARFYAAFLAWRSSNGWDNAIAEHLPAMFRDAGLRDIQSIASDEVAEPGAPDFDGASAIWTRVIESVGLQFYGERERTEAAESYNRYRRTALLRQTLSMLTIIGTKPA